MKKIVLVLTAIVLFAACTTPEVSQTDKENKEFFAAEVVEAFIPGETTQEQIRASLGEPYPDPLKSPERWTYMYTFERQIIFTFDKGVLTGKQWSEQYGIGSED